MSLGDVVDELLNQDSLADTGTSEKPNLSTTGVRGKKVDNFNASLEHLSSRRLVNERRGLSVDGAELNALDGTPLVDGLADDVHDTTERLATDRDLDRRAGIDDFLPTDETLGTVHGNGTDRVLTQMGRDLEDETTAVEVLDLEGVENGREVVRLELHVNDGTNDGLDGADGCLGLSRIGARWVRKITWNV